MRVVDIGAGPGLDTEAFAGAGFDAVGLDRLMDEMIDRMEADVRGD